MEIARKSASPLFSSWVLKLGILQRAVFMQIERRREAVGTTQPVAPAARAKIPVMLIEDLPAFIQGVVPPPYGHGQISHYHLTFNKSDAGTWSAGYIHYDSGRIILGINFAESLNEVAIRLNGRLQRYMKSGKMPPPLQDLPNQDTVRSANITEGRNMADDQKLTHGQELVGVKFNPSQEDSVDQLKQHAAAMIDILEDIHATSGKDADTQLLQDNALETIINAQMAAVKRATWKLTDKQGVAGPGPAGNTGADDGAAPDPGPNGDGTSAS